MRKNLKLRNNKYELHCVYIDDHYIFARRMLNVLLLAVEVAA
jgi:hypothetical protein